MKETINVNIGGCAFTLDKDAYERLSDYLADVRNRVNDPTGEVMQDIERGFADIFAQALSSSMMVVTLAITEAAISRMGKPEEFGPARATTTEGEPKNRVENNGQLRRSRTDRSVAGVCGGIAKYFNIESSLVRLVVLLFIIFGGLSLWIYVILWILIPEE